MPDGVARDGVSGRRAGWLAALALAVGCAHSPLADIDPSALSLEDTQGARVRLSAYAGEVVVVSFFATWCFFCLGDIPRLEALQESRGKDGLQVIAIGLDREGAAVLDPFRTYYHLSFPVLIGSDRFAHEGLPFAPVTMLPSTYVIGRDGRVVEHWDGVIPDKLLGKVLDEALAKH